MGFLKSTINAVADPRVFFVLAAGSLVVLLWKRERIASNAVGYTNYPDNVVRAFVLESAAAGDRQA